MPWRSLSKPRSDRLEGGAAPADGWGGITQTTAVRCGSRLTLPARSGRPPCKTERLLEAEVSQSRLPGRASAALSSSPSTGSGSNDC